eukprot:scaffold15476_cov24-Phaeocystis_antarctica.AAC.1
MRTRRIFRLPAGPSPIKRGAVRRRPTDPHRAVARVVRSARRRAVRRRLERRRRPRRRRRRRP